MENTADDDREEGGSDTFLLEESKPKAVLKDEQNRTEIFGGGAEKKILISFLYIQKNRETTDVRILF